MKYYTSYTLDNTLHYTRVLCSVLLKIDYYITADSIDAASQRLTAVYIYLQTQIKVERPHVSPNN